MRLWQYILLIVLAAVTGLIGGALSNPVFNIGTSTETRESLAVWLQVIASTLLLASVFGLWFQIIITHIWQKRKAAVDLASRIHTIGYYKWVKKLGEIKGSDGKPIDIDRKDQTYTDVVNEDNEEQVREQIFRILTLCEEISFGVLHKVYDEELVYSFFGYFIQDHYRWARPYIEEKRREIKETTAHINLQELCAKWSKKGAC